MQYFSVKSKLIWKSEDYIDVCLDLRVSKADDSIRETFHKINKLS